MYTQAFLAVVAASSSLVSFRAGLWWGSSYTSGEVQALNRVVGLLDRCQSDRGLGLSEFDESSRLFSFGISGLVVLLSIVWLYRGTFVVRRAEPRAILDGVCSSEAETISLVGDRGRSPDRSRSVPLAATPSSRYGRRRA